ncbi:MAG TPA: hypothetical protein VHM31_17960, partial [Polyangia bacterium]|nr:hypothetical protein [Polyangia bacterium]
MKVQSAVLATLSVAIACGAGTGCSSTAGKLSGSGGSSSGGTIGTGSGGSASGGSPGGGSCPNVAACGGSAVGTWVVSSSCLKVSGTLDLGAFGAGCPTAPVTGTLQVNGSWTAKADGTYTDDTTTTGTEQITLDKSCLVISSTPVTCAGAASLLVALGYATFQCTDASGGGCDCTATVNEKGGLGVVSPAPSTDGNFATSGNLLTLTDVGETKYDYCATGTTLTVTPRSSSPTLTGTIAFQKGTPTSTGGTIGTGGARATGGAGG